MDTRGIFQYPDGRYRVRVTRGNVTYMIGWRDTYEDALKARNDWLIEYEKERHVRQYSKKWFEIERRKQVQDFLTKYGADRKGAARLIVVNREYTPFGDGIL